MKNITLFILVLILGTTEIYSQTPTQPNGSGSVANPYQIASLENLYWLSLSDTAWHRNYIQTADIDATTTSGWDEGSGFKPIGNGATNFTGSYNGRGFIIDHLFISRSMVSFVGFFGYLEGAFVDSLGMTNVDISGRSNIGGLVGVNLSFSVVSYCYSTGQVSGAQYYVGGLVGENSLSAQVKNCFSSASAHAGADYAGGLVGISNGSFIENSYSTGLVSGGLGIGGLLGRNQTSSVINCYSTGVPSGSSDVGGLIGGEYSSTVSNSFWDTETSTKETSSGGTGKTTAEMKTLCNYVDGIEASWDFMNTTGNGTEDFWGLNLTVNNGYPFLSWQGFDHLEVCCAFEDAVNPELSVQDISLQLDETGTAELAVKDVVTYASDNCSVADTTVSRSAFDCSDTDASVSVEVILTDESGNTVTKIISVTVEDHIVPEITCLGDQVIDLVEGQSAYLVNGTEFDPVETSDNCEVFTLENNFNSSASLAGESLPIGSTVITWVVSDGSENQQTCNYSIQVNEYVGIDDAAKHGKILVYPNPAKTQVQIEYGYLMVESIQLLDITGKSLKELTVDANPLVIDISDLTEGVFFVKVITHDSAEFLRFVKKL